jgi:hypothetical protein
MFNRVVVCQANVEYRTGQRRVSTRVYTSFDPIRDDGIRSPIWCSLTIRDDVLVKALKGYDDIFEAEPGLVRDI